MNHFGHSKGGVKHQKSVNVWPLQVSAISDFPTVLACDPTMNRLHVQTVTRQHHDDPEHRRISLKTKFKLLSEDSAPLCCH